MEENSTYRYYIKEVDLYKESIYCHQGLIEESIIKEHKHQKAQFLYTEGGVVYVNINQKTYFLPARHFMWIPPGVEHSIHPSNPRVTMRNVYFPIGETEPSFYKSLAIYPANDLVLEYMLYLERYSKDIFQQDEVNYTILKSFKYLLAHVNSKSLSLSLPEVKEKRLKQVTDYLAANLHQNFNFKKIALKFGLSDRTLSRLFKQELELSFIQYLTILRMLKALKYLLDERLPVNEVAGLVGFSSVPSFSNTFSRIVGERPSVYQQHVKV